MKRILLSVFVVLSLASCMDIAVPPQSVFLGDRTVAFRGDHDVITVGRYEGTFRSLYFVVRRNDVELANLVVVYGNGERERIETRLVFNEGSRSRLIDLQGGRRRIQSIQFSYKTVGTWADGKALVAVYGVR
jgi:hypothetical protein